MARSRPRVVTRSARRDTVWLFFGPTSTTISGVSSATVISSLNAAALALRPFTVVRTRGTLHYHSDQSAADESYGGGFGLAVVSDQAVAVGITAVPTPVTDYGSDLWFLIEQLHGRVEFLSGVGFEGSNGRERMIDSKAMRKVDVGEDIVVVAETASFQSSNVLVSSFRMLVKLH